MKSVTGSVHGGCGSPFLLLVPVVPVVQVGHDCLLHLLDLGHHLLLFDPAHMKSRIELHMRFLTLTLYVHRTLHANVYCALDGHLQLVLSVQIGLFDPFSQDFQMHQPDQLLHDHHHDPMHMNEWPYNLNIM